MSQGLGDRAPVQAARAPSPLPHEIERLPRRPRVLPALELPDPSVPAPPPRTVTGGRRRWQRKLARSMAVTDALSVLVAVSTAFVVVILPQAGTVVPPAGDYVLISIGLVAAWLLATSLYRTRDHKLLGAGPAEYQALARATFLVFGWTAIASLVFTWSLSRGFLVIALGLGFALLLLTRKAWRLWLRSRRSHHRLVARTLVIGGVRSARTMASRFSADPANEFAVVGLWVPDRTAVPGEAIHVEETEIPVQGMETPLPAILDCGGVDTVVVTDTEHLGSDGISELAWELEGRDIDLLVAPNIADVAGPRIHVDAHSAMPLIYLSRPTYSAARTLRKAAFDRAIALGVLLVSLPVLVVAALAVRLSGAGPIFYRSERIGAGGVPFQMMKLRTMVDGADRMRAALEVDHDGAGPLFKKVDDPRVTPVGRFLRRYSIDELPQFINVLRGEMSVVGPRPPLRSEVDLYDDTVRRRLLVKQGITGLWPVSGRSDLSWEDSVRLDLTYVENWSMLRDLHIMARTAKAVLFARGAY
ncbi:sugar transferase [Aeromicrobium halocynthiae]|uniref:sugar transferase n=1 Tax=Aeromicrobium halocynthiae TaxID=560557 RepID=UPI0031DA096A